MLPYVIKSLDYFFVGAVLEQFDVCLCYWKRVWCLTDVCVPIVGAGRVGGNGKDCAAGMESFSLYGGRMQKTQPGVTLLIPGFFVVVGERMTAEARRDDALHQSARPQTQGQERR